MVQTPSQAKAASNDPLASIRSKLKAAKPVASSQVNKPAPKTSTLSSDDRLARLEKAVKELLGVATTDQARAQLKQFS